MVLVNGNKYACETCIKGHRSSTCRHTDRPLFEIKKKGRPVTQCDHCRELRKTKQVHVKCNCEGKEEQPPTTKKGHAKITGSAAFPLGLPEALGARVAFTSSEGASSDSENGSGRKTDCGCKSGASCDCCTPRKTAPKIRKKKDSGGPSPQQLPDPSGSLHDIRTPSHILARLAELRPVLPRPSSLHNQFDAGSSHDPSSGIAHGHNRHHSHENLLFSPYSRAYEYTHEQAFSDDAQPQAQHQPQHPSNLPIPNYPYAVSSTQNLVPTVEQIFRDHLQGLEDSDVALSTWILPNSSNLSEPSIPFPSTCNCGESCTCPGCSEHNEANAASSLSAFSSCTKPGVCTSCIDCTILSLPVSLPPDTSLSIYDAHDAVSIDDWIRQVSSLPPPSSGISTPEPKLIGHQQPQQEWEGYLPPVMESTRVGEGYVVQPCCGVLCKCMPEECACDLDNETGYDCRNEMLFPTFPTAMALSQDADNAAYGERNTPLQHYPQENALQNNSSLLLDAGRVAIPRALSYDPAVDLTENGAARSQSANHTAIPIGTNLGYLAIPQLSRSRSSSTSSRSSASQEPPPPSSYQFPPAMRMFGYMGPYSMTMSTPNLGIGAMKLGLDLSHERVYGGAGSMSGNSSPSSTSGGNVGGVNYAISNPDSDGYM